MVGELLVGTSGWQYRDWRGAFYPRGLRQADWLGFYAARFPVVEVDSTFYRLPEASTFAAWAAATPDGFRFTIKASRYLTHVRRLQDPREPVRRLLDRAGGLGPKLGAILIQLPPDLPCDLRRLDAVVAAFPSDVRVAFEPRHPSWPTGDTVRRLEAAGWALCLTDRRGRHGPLVATADWCYLRMHEGRATPAPRYGRRALRGWWERLVALHGPRPEGYVLFNNDAGAAAVANATAFGRLARRAVARAPAARSSQPAPSSPAPS